LRGLSSRHAHGCCMLHHPRRMRVTLSGIHFYGAINTSNFLWRQTRCPWVRRIVVRDRSRMPAQSSAPNCVPRLSGAVTAWTYDSPPIPPAGGPTRPLSAVSDPPWRNRLPSPADPRSRTAIARCATRRSRRTHLPAVPARSVCPGRTVPHYRPPPPSASPAADLSPRTTAPDSPHRRNSTRFHTPGDDTGRSLRVSPTNWTLNRQDRSARTGCRSRLARPTSTGPAWSRRRWSRATLGAIVEASVSGRPSRAGTTWPSGIQSSKRAVPYWARRVTA